MVAVTQSSYYQQIATYVIVAVFAASSGIFGFGTYGAEPSHDSIVFCANAAFARMVQDLQVVGASVWLFRMYDEKATDEIVMDFYQFTATLNLHAVLPWQLTEMRDEKVSDTGVLLDRACFWISLTFCMAVFVHMKVRFLRSLLIRDILKKNPDVDHEKITPRLRLFFPRVEGNALRFIMIPSVISATGYLGEVIINAGPEGKNNAEGILQVVYSYLWAFVLLGLQLYIAWNMVSKAEFVHGEHVFTEKEYEGWARKQKRRRAKANAPLHHVMHSMALDHLSSHDAGYWQSAPHRHFVQRFGTFLHPIRSLTSMSHHHVFEHLPAYVEFYRNILRITAVMACTSAGAAGIGRALAAAVAAGLMMLDAVLIIATHPYVTFSTNALCALTSLGIAAGYAGFFLHFNGDGDNMLEVAYTCHAAAAAASVLFEGSIVLFHFKHKSPPMPDIRHVEEYQPSVTQTSKKDDLEPWNMADQLDQTGTPLSRNEMVIEGSLGGLVIEVDDDEENGLANGSAKSNGSALGGIGGLLRSSFRFLSPSKNE